MFWHFIKVSPRLPNEGPDRTIEMTGTTARVMRFILLAGLELRACSSVKRVRRLDPCLTHYDKVRRHRALSSQ